jgi:hypothetical protein
MRVAKEIKELGCRLGFDLFWIMGTQTQQEGGHGINRKNMLHPKTSINCNLLQNNI